MPKRKPSNVGDELGSLLAILDLVRHSGPITRLELGNRTGYGRTVVTQRVKELIDGGLVEDGESGPSTGGRAPRQVRMRRDAGHVLVAQIAIGLSFGICDASGSFLVREHVHDLPDSSPEMVVSAVEEAFDRLLAERPADAPPLWGIGVGLPGPVDFEAGTPVSPTYYRGWDGYPVRDRLWERYGVPTWVDNHVNLMTLGELRAGTARASSNVVFIEVGPGVGAGLAADGRLHRGANGAAGHIGHTPVRWDDDTQCRCGSTGCLEAMVGQEALVRRATVLGQEGLSSMLSEVLSRRGRVEAADVVVAASTGDGEASRLLIFAGERVGEMLATFVNMVNPELVVVGGELGLTSDVFLASLRESLYRGALPLATRDLAIERSALGKDGVLHGAANMVIDELLSARYLGGWLGMRIPGESPALQAPTSGSSVA